MIAPTKSADDRAGAWRGLWLRPPVFLLVLLPVVMLDASRAGAQIADAWLRYTPVDAYAGTRSTRLAGMGSIQVAVEDDEDLFDPYHYGRNPAGLLMSRDTSIVVIPTSYQNFDDRYFGRSHSAVGRGMGFRGEFRPNARWGMAGEIGYGQISASRHDLCPDPDDCRFIRDFDLPLAPQIAPITSDRTVGAGVQTPLASVTYARTFFTNVTLGGRFGFRHEAENRQLAFNISVDDNLGRSMVTDSKRLQQVLKNLLSNAFKFTEQGGVRLSVSAAVGGWSDDHPILSNASSVIAFEVADTGIIRGDTRISQINSALAPRSSIHDD